MSKMKKDMLVAVALVIFIIGGALYFAIRLPISPAPSLEPTATVTPTSKIEESEEAKVEAEKDGTFSVTLASNPTTGYQWEADFDSGYLELVDKEYIPSTQDPSIVGAGGTEKFTFLALKQGETQINFSYLRPWEKDEKPIETEIYKIAIK